MNKKDLVNILNERKEVDNSQYCRNQASSVSTRSDISGANGLPRFNNDDMDISPGSSPLSCCSSNSQANCNWHYKRQSHVTRHANSLQPNTKKCKDDSSNWNSFKHSSGDSRVTTTKPDAPQNAALRQLVDALRESLGSILAHSPASSISTPNVSNSKSVNEHTNANSASRSITYGSNGPVSDTHCRSITSNRLSDKHVSDQRDNMNRQMSDSFQESQTPRGTLSTTPNTSGTANTSPPVYSKNSTRQLKNVQTNNPGGSASSRTKNMANTLSALFNLLGAAAPSNSGGIPGAKPAKSPCTVNPKYGNNPGLNASLPKQSPSGLIPHLVTNHLSMIRHPSSSASPLMPSPITPLSATTSHQLHSCFLRPTDEISQTSDISSHPLVSRHLNQAPFQGSSSSPSLSSGLISGAPHKEHRMQVHHPPTIASFNQLQNSTPQS
ncbi:unnamed protein product [Protopolystoma xenopodis]|uniref:Uncharacterized protein n=1 Tax=Protopolystoma xenopodis TaxID=117903 RepID=A0A3S5BE43_9PLAT|nr:unnamed protein product [Protopolystoma xenopodis]